MPYASLALQFAPTSNPAVGVALQRPAVGVALQRALLATGRAAGFATTCAAAAAFTWLVLAGPGVMSDHASTVAGRHTVR